MECVNKISSARTATFTFGTALLVGCGGGGGGSASASDAHTAVLNWSAPMTRVNGESITMGELDRYVIRFGQSPRALKREVVVPNAQSRAQMSYAIRGLDGGTWYFTIQVQDTNGLLSEPSAIVSKTVRS